MRVFLGFVRKETHHVLRDRRTLLVLFGLPLVLMLLFGYALRNEVEDIATVVVDRAGDPASQQVLAALGGSPYFHIVATLPNTQVAESWLQDGRARLVLTLEPDLQESLLSGSPRYQILVDGSDPNTARTMVAYATRLVEGTLLSESLGTSQGLALGPQSSAGPPVRLQGVVHMAFNPELDSAYLFVPGLMALVLTLVSALMTSVTITREKELGTMEVLLVSPLRPIQIIVGKVVPYLVLSLINVLVILGLARFAFAVPIRGSLALLIGESLLFTICALSLGVLVSTKASTQQAATTASMSSLMFPTILLSGFIFPLASMPEILQWLSHLVPARWFVEIVRGIMLKGLGLAELWSQTLILSAMTVTVLAVSLRNFRTRLE
ncbi:MAG: ABC transporter permease [Acidobacteriota bacterium]|nr:ABC transporter permease [Acidobacteriota bacterium]